MSVDDLEKEALNLPLTERARLARTLLDSLETLSEEEIEALWLDEAVRRDREAREGRVTMRTSEEVIQDARAKLT